LLSPSMSSLGAPSAGNPGSNAKESSNDNFVQQPPDIPLLSPQLQSSPIKPAKPPRKPVTPRALTRLRQHNAPGLKQEAETFLPKLRSMRKSNN
jgi:hypothetical protein